MYVSVSSQCQYQSDTPVMDWLHLIAQCGWGKGLRWWGSRRDCILVTPHYRDRHHGLTLSHSHYFLPLCDKLWSQSPRPLPSPAGHNNLISNIPSIPIIKPSPASRLPRLKLMSRFPSLSLCCTTTSCFLSERPSDHTDQRFNDSRDRRRGGR